MRLNCYSENKGKIEFEKDSRVGIKVPALFGGEHRECLRIEALRNLSKKV